MTDQDSQNIIRAVVELGGALGMKTIAEGIEDARQMGMLAVLGCEEGQGYHFSKPLPADAFRHWMERHNLGTPVQCAPAKRYTKVQS